MLRLYDCLKSKTSSFKFESGFVKIKTNGIAETQTQHCPNKTLAGKVK